MCVWLIFAAIIVIPWGLINSGQANTTQATWELQIRESYTDYAGHTWLLLFLNQGCFLNGFGVFTFAIVRLCVSDLCLCFILSRSHNITQHCAKIFSSTKAFSFAITLSSQSFPRSTSALPLRHHVCLLASLCRLFLSVYLLYQLTVILCMSVS